MRSGARLTRPRPPPPPDRARSLPPQGCAPVLLAVAIFILTLVLVIAQPKGPEDRLGCHDRGGPGARNGGGSPGRHPDRVGHRLERHGRICRRHHHQPAAGPGGLLRVGGAARRSLGRRPGQAPVRPDRAPGGGRGLGVRQRRRGADPHADRHRHAGGAEKQRQGHARLRHGGGVHRRHGVHPARRLQPGQHRLRRLLQAELRRLRPGDGPGDARHHHGHLGCSSPPFRAGDTRGLRPGGPQTPKRGDPRPRRVRHGLGGAGGAPGRLLRPAAAGCSRERGRGGWGRRASPGGRPWQGGQPCGRPARGALAGRDLLARHVSGRLRPAERRAHRLSLRAVRGLRRRRRLGRDLRGRDRHGCPLPRS